MRFSAATVLAFASAVLAQTAGFDPITTPTEDENVAAGSTFEVDWQPSSATTYPGTVSLILLGGSSPSTLSILSTIASGIDNSGKYEWAVASTLGSFSTYGLKLQLDSNSSIFQYSFPFHITGGSSSSASASGSTSASGSASASGSVTTTASSGSMTTSAMMSSVTSAPGNLSTTAGPKTITSIVSASKTTTSGTSVATGAAVNLAAGSFAMLGGLAMAALAL